MLRLSFKRLGLSSSLEAKDLLEFRGSELCVDNQTAPIGRYGPGYWIYANERWPYAECRSAVILRFEAYDGQTGPVIGPRHSLLLRDRFIFAGRERIATLLPNRGRWQVAGGDESWPILRVQPYS
jgi:hypothetical protein